MVIPYHSSEKERKEVHNHNIKESSPTFEGTKGFWLWVSLGLPLIREDECKRHEFFMSFKRQKMFSTGFGSSGILRSTKEWKELRRMMLKFTTQSIDSGVLSLASPSSTVNYPIVRLLLKTKKASNEMRHWMSSSMYQHSIKISITMRMESESVSIFRSCLFL
jgi:hypothetical protein